MDVSWPIFGKIYDFIGDIFYKYLKNIYHADIFLWVFLSLIFFIFFILVNFEFNFLVVTIHLLTIFFMILLAFLNRLRNKPVI